VADTVPGLGRSGIAGGGGSIDAVAVAVAAERVGTGALAVTTGCGPWGLLAGTGTVGVRLFGSAVGRSGLEGLPVTDASCVKVRVVKC
jgi:hypothetical protein